jgi:hypothetical protein
MMIKRILLVVLVGCSIPAGIYAVSVMQSGTRSIGTVTNIHGIPFPEVDGAVHILEDMAHTFIYLREPVAFKTVEVVVTFHPGNATHLAVGIRENPFWLSYPKHTIYEEGAHPAERQTRQITIPLTDKLQRPDRSIDMMFFAESEQEVSWQLYDIEVTVTPAMAPRDQLRQYIRSIIRKERPL